MSTTTTTSTTTSPDDEFIDFHDHGRTPPVSSRILYLVAALPVSALPILLFVRVLAIDVAKVPITLTLGTVIATVVLSLAYHNVMFFKKVRLDKRAPRVSKGAFKGKGGDYDAAVKSREASVAKAAFCYAMFYVNTIYLSLILILGFYLVKGKIPDDFNYAASAVSSSLVAFLMSRKFMKSV